MTELFVSYCRDDSAVMEPIVENLRQLGFDLWVDVEHLKPGTPAWTQAIDEALLRADGVLAFLSPSAKKSHWCNIETQRAQMYEKPVYPILVSGEPKDAVPIHLTGAQLADMRGRASREKNFDVLVKTMARDFDHPLPEFDLKPGQGGVPVVNIIHVSGHVEGNVYALNVGGDVTGEVNVAGGDIIHEVQAPPSAPPEPAFDALAVYRQAVEARQAGEHTAAIKLLDTLQTEAPDLFPDQVIALIEDSQAQLEAQAQRREYLRAYQHVTLLALDPVTLDDAQQLWLELREAYPNIDHDPEGLSEKLESGPDLGGILDILPMPFEWCEIPGKQAFSLETDNGNMGTYDIAPFFMAKYQTTYEQFQVFIDAADGFKNDEWWQGLAKRESSPGTQEWKINNHPRENVSWYDAVAFCRWLSSKVGYEVRLPTEWEWQWAAQGSDGRAYPWGNDFDKNRCNTSESSLGKTTPVDQYLNGASPFGVLDMSGNVWEWCLNEYDEPGRVETTGDARRVLRGGSWDYSGSDARAAARRNRSPYGRNGYFGGFRVVGCVPVLK